MAARRARLFATPAAQWSTRVRFSEAAGARLAETTHTLRRNNIDTISLRTGDDYLPALRAFFKQRERRMARR